jgi:hypothetical protein
MSADDRLGPAVSTGLGDFLPVTMDMGADIGVETWLVRRGFRGLIGLYETGPGGLVGRWYVKAFVDDWDGDRAITRTQIAPVVLR